MYDVLFTEKAERQLRKLEKHVRERIISALERARIRPEAHFQKLVGDKAYKLRAGDYRIIADILRDKLVILVLKAGHRRNIYK
ncbi:MAG: type II toxin-antitoxin system RelE/ParE family toxin [Candidatus Diapherotrites archaeon]|nr:type II toxin-antitoxin system RelE/ParE family toxin [Candidatus Diapherotrites archaeon]